MGYSPIGIQKDAIEMQNQKNKLLEIHNFLINNPDKEEYQGYNLKTVTSAIASIESFEFLP